MELALDFQYIIKTDITDCYSSIYTHSIAWAIHGKNFAKQNQKDKTLLGNKIDNLLQDMHHGQTNGVPQGSALMDFIAEIVLGYSDELLAEKLNSTEFQKEFLGE
ncbi:TPA: RNA-directed DNA polymerase, partial [Legionella pneumophila]